MLAFIYAPLQLNWVLDEREDGRDSLVAGRNAMAWCWELVAASPNVRSLLETGRGCSVAGRREEEAFSGRVVQANDSCWSAHGESLKGPSRVGQRLLRIQATALRANMRETTNPPDIRVQGGEVEGPWWRLPAAGTEESRP